MFTRSFFILDIHKSSVTNTPVTKILDPHKSPVTNTPVTNTPVTNILDILLHAQHPCNQHSWHPQSRFVFLWGKAVAQTKHQIVFWQQSQATKVSGHHKFTDQHLVIHKNLNDTLSAPSGLTIAALYAVCGHPVQIDADEKASSKPRKS